jgi:hypothetical protein
VKLDQYKFTTARHQATRRGIKFLFEFDEWVLWWEKRLGKNWQKKRGTKNGQYVMARHGDEGHYEWDNVKCITAGQNSSEAKLGKRRAPFSKIHRRRISEAQLGRIFSEVHRRHMSEARRGKPLSEAHRRKLSAAKLGKSLSICHRQNIAAGVRLAWREGRR